MHDTPVERLKAALGGRYTIELALGEGGMATVYLAQDLKHNRRVASQEIPDRRRFVLVKNWIREVEERIR